MDPTESDQPGRNSRLAGAVAAAIHAEPKELKAVVLAFSYFFCLMGGYYVLRPIRDELAASGGEAKIPWLFTATFVAMLLAVPLFSATAAKLPRHRFIPLAYRFFLLVLLGFWAAFSMGVPREHMRAPFFVAVGVYNLFVVSVFWSFMADIFRHGQGKRLFGFIAAGGSAGALAGPLLTTLLVKPLGPTNLLLVQIVMLEVCVHCVRALHRWSVRTHGPVAGIAEQQPLGGDFLSGIKVVFQSPFLLGIAAYILMMTATSTFLYLEQAQIVVKAGKDAATRTALFARIDLVVNVLTLLLQTLVTARLVKRMGVVAGIALLPIVTALGFVAISIAPTIAVLTIVQGLRRATHHGVERPSREILFTAVDREQKYKSKNFIDTVVYRGGDALSSWTGTGLKALGLGVLPLAAAAVSICALWLWNALFLARRDQQHADHGAAPAAGDFAGERT